MANQRVSGLTIRPLDLEGAQDRGVLPVAYGGGRAGEALAGVAGGLASRVGALADQLTVADGRRQGQTEGTAPDFRPSNGWTLRDQARDAAGVETYLSTLTARFQSDAMDLFERNKDNPAGFKAGYDGLVEGYRRNHVFPEVDGAFQARATTLGTTLRMQALRSFDAKEKDQRQAAFLSNSAARDAVSQRLLAIDPSDPGTESLILHNRDNTVADIRALVNDGTISAVAGEEAIQKEMNNARLGILNARAATLKTPDEIEAYRRKLRQDFVDGKLDGLNDWQKLDAGLATLAGKRRVEAEQALKALQGDAKDLLERQGAGNDSPTDWLALAGRAKAIGPAAERAVRVAQQKLEVRKRVASLGLDEADAYVRALEASARSGPAIKADAAERAQAAMDFFMAKGLTREQAAGIVGHGLWESGGFTPSNVTPHDGADGSDSVGIFQMNAERADRMKAFAAARGKDWTDLQSQLEWTWQELETDPANSGGALERLRQAKTVEEAAAAWAHYERPRGYRRNGDMTQIHGWSNRLAFAQKMAGTASGPSAGQAEVLADANATLAARRRLVGTDPLLLASQEGKLSGGIASVDFAAAPADVALQFRARVAQAEAAAGHYRTAPVYIRPDEKPVVQAILDKGGEPALKLIEGVTAGAGSAALPVLSELGHGAPALAHASLVSLSTGDRAFALQVAEAQAARAAPGARPSSIRDTDLQAATRDVLGGALQGLDAAEQERTRAAALAWSERELVRRGIDPALDPSGTQAVLAEGLQRARGRTGDGGRTFGGVADVPYGPKGWISAHAATVKVQVPTSIRTDRFADVLEAVADADLAALPDPPVTRKGETLTAEQLRRLAPVFVPGGLAYAAIDPTTNRQTPITARSGKPFVLPLPSLLPTLRQRVPDAFR